MIVMILVSATASAQYRPNPFFFNFKGVKADSVQIVPRDTIYANAGTEPDSARIAYKDRSLWIRNAQSWNRLSMLKQVGVVIDEATDVITIPGLPNPVIKFQSAQLVGKTLFMVFTNGVSIMPVPSISDLYTLPNGHYYFDPVTGTVLFEYYMETGSQVQIVYQ